MSLNYFIFDGESSLDYGVYIGGQDTYNAPQRDITKVGIPGRNGDLIQDNGRFLNVQVPYHIVVMDEFRDKTDAIKAWLLSKKGYCKLVDTYHPGTYRMARVQGGIDFETGAYNLHGKTKIIFDCKPQRWLDSGDVSVEYGDNPGAIENPTLFDSLPMIHIEGNGSGVVTVGNASVSISNLAGYVDIDCELKLCYKGGENMSQYVSMTDHKFPVLKPGNNNIAFSGGITGVTIKGRWWTI